MNRTLRMALIASLAAAGAAALATWLVRDQMDRHQRDLFNPRPLRRLAALGYMAGAEASVDHIRLLEDFIAWESRKLLRRRARKILDRMEREAQAPAAS